MLATGVGAGVAAATLPDHALFTQRFSTLTLTMSDRPAAEAGTTMVFVFPILTRRRHFSPDTEAHMTHRYALTRPANATDTDPPTFSVPTIRGGAAPNADGAAKTPTTNTRTIRTIQCLIRRGIEMIVPLHCPSFGARPTRWRGRQRERSTGQCLFRVA